MTNYNYREYAIRVINAYLKNDFSPGLPENWEDMPVFSIAVDRAEKEMLKIISNAVNAYRESDGLMAQVETLMDAVKMARADYVALGSSHDGDYDETGLRTLGQIGERQMNEALAATEPKP